MSLGTRISAVFLTVGAAIGLPSSTPAFSVSNGTMHTPDGYVLSLRPVALPDTPDKLGLRAGEQDRSLTYFTSCDDLKQPIKVQQLFETIAYGMKYQGPYRAKHPNFRFSLRSLYPSAVDELRKSCE
jgi:hypothetical protein